MTFATHRHAAFRVALLLFFCAAWAAPLHAGASISTTQTEHVLDTAPGSTRSSPRTTDAQARAQFLQWALLLAARTL